MTSEIKTKQDVIPSITEAQLNGSSCCSDVTFWCHCCKRCLIYAFSVSLLSDICTEVTVRIQYGGSVSRNAEARLYARIPQQGSVCIIP